MGDEEDTLTTDSAFVMGALPMATRAEALAEESSELAHAALKLARVLRGENPTPKTQDEAVSHLRDEFDDVVVASAALGLSVQRGHIREKAARWRKRIEEKGDRDESR